MNHLTSLNDGPTALGGAVVRETSHVDMPQPREVMPEPMPTDTFTPIPGQRRKPCCGGRGDQIVNVNVNAGNNNGNGNGADVRVTGTDPGYQRGSAHDGREVRYDAAGRPIAGNPSILRRDENVPMEGPVRIQRVEVPVERVVEKVVTKPVYKPLVVVREKIKKIFQREYKPQNIVYERRVGRSYENRPMTFEGKKP